MSMEDPFATSGTVKFPEIGSTVEGRIVSWEMTQQTDFHSGKPKFFDDGNPMMQLVVTLDIDGEQQKLYVPRKGNNKPGTKVPWGADEPSPLWIALRNATQKSGSPMQAGGVFKIRYDADGEAQAGLNPPKLYRAKYEAPKATFDEFDTPAPAPQPAPTPAAPAADEDF